MQSMHRYTIRGMFSIRYHDQVSHSNVSTSSPDDYDEWASQGLEGWNYDDLDPYMRKAESFTTNPSQVALGADDLTTHGKQGPWQIGYSYLSGVTTSFLDACAQAGFDRVDDINTFKGTNGAVRFQTFISKNGQRSSTATAYLAADVLARPNLRIATGQNVTRIIFDTSSRTPRAVGVELASSALSLTRYLVRARAEVLLSAGAVHTPHILKLSGIGPAAELSAHNIPLVADLPHVGANLADHLICKVNTRVKPGLSVQHLTHPLRGLVALIEWLRYGTGAGTTNTAESALFYRTADHPVSPSSSSAQEALKVKDLSSGSRASDMEILSCSAFYMDHGTKPANLSLDYHSMGAILLRPQSRGSITLTSSSPFAKPLIRANYLSTPHDRDMMLHGLRTCQKIAETKAYKDVMVQWETPERGLEGMSDEEMLQYVRSTSETIYHPMCTARMGMDEEGSVVDARLRVHGVKGLRVVDASVFPEVLACHPVSYCLCSCYLSRSSCHVVLASLSSLLNPLSVYRQKEPPANTKQCAPVVMVAEKAADMIKEDQRPT